MLRVSATATSTLMATAMIWPTMTMIVAVERSAWAVLAMVLAWSMPARAVFVASANISVDVSCRSVPSSLRRVQLASSASMAWR